MRAKTIYENEDNGWVDVEDNTEKTGYFEIQYKHQTAEDDYDIDETRIIDPYDMDVYLGMSFGLNLADIDDGLGVNVEYIKKIKDDEWLFITNYGKRTLTLDDLEHLADKR